MDQVLGNQPVRQTKSFVDLDPGRIYRRLFGESIHRDREKIHGARGRRYALDDFTIYDLIELSPSVASRGLVILWKMVIGKGFVIAFVAFLIIGWKCSVKS